MDMFLVGIISWWYGRGWIGQWGRIIDRWERTLHFFSIGQLLLTLFAPYRQIAASVNDRSFSTIMKGLLDQLVSRIVGAVVRLFTIAVGVLAIYVQIVLETIVMIVWWVLPLTPIIGAVLFAMGWLPWQ